MQSMVMGCCCGSAPIACCHSSLMCVVNNGVFTDNSGGGGSWQVIGNTSAANFGGTPCGSIGCTTYTGGTGTNLAVVPQATVVASWALSSSRWNNAYDLCTILPPGSGVHAGEMNRNPLWNLRLNISRTGSGFSPSFTLTVFYRRLSQTPPQFQCPSLGVYEYFSQSTTGTYGGFMSTSSSVTLI